MADIFNQILEVQRDLKAPKGQYNSFGKYKYRSAEDILEAVKPLNAEKGLLLTLSDEPVLIGDRHYIKATATVTNGKETHTVTAYAREASAKKGMDESQVTGTASSYARKYALNGLYLIDDTKDADTDEYQNQNNRTPSKQPQPITSEQVGLIKTKALEFAELRGGTEQDVYKALNIKEVTKLTGKQAEANIKKLSSWLAKANQEQGA